MTDKTPNANVDMANSGNRRDRAVLQVVRDLVVAFDAAGISYCHWKSNEHLAASAAGLTDLDILVDRRQEHAIEVAIATAGFKRFAAPPLRAYPAIADYLGFDAQSGRIVHLHLHYELTLGEAHLKSYRLPLERRITDASHYDDDFGIRVAAPAHELILLLVRYALKKRWRDRLRARFTRPSSRGSIDMRREFTWLSDRVDAAALRAAAQELLEPQLAALLEHPPGHLLEPAILDPFSRAARASLARYRSLGPTAAKLRAWAREAQWAIDVCNRRYLGRAVPLRRTSPRGGAVIVLLGSDGAGKSTLAAVLRSWLGAKLDVQPIYFGSGDGHAAYYRLPLIYARRLAALAKGLRKAAATMKSPAPTAGARSDPRTAGASTRSGLARVPWALLLSLEKRGKLRRMIRARNRGMIVICDRYPQAVTTGFNDGPLLSHWRESASSLARRLATWEAAPYEQAASLAPDLVLKLDLAASVALERRPEMTREEIERRRQAVRQMAFASPTRVAIVDAAVPLDEVHSVAKSLVWAIL